MLLIYTTKIDEKRTILQSSRFLRSTTLPFLRKFVSGDGCALLYRPEKHNSVTYLNYIFITDVTRPHYEAPLEEGCIDIRAPHHRSDVNLFRSTDGKVPELFAANSGADVKGGFRVRQALDRAGREATGRDRHSVFADPGFADIGSGDRSGADEKTLELIGFEMYPRDQAGVEKEA